MTKSRTASPAPGGTDWTRVNAFADAEIERMAEADPENPATTAEHWASATVGFPPLENPANAKLDGDMVGRSAKLGTSNAGRQQSVRAGSICAEKLPVR